MLTNAGAALKMQHVSNHRIFLTVGTEEKKMQIDAYRFAAFCARLPTAIMKVYYFPFHSKTHATILHRAVYRAFETFYNEK